ncbi:hypothetical protein ABZ860_30825 [Microbispora sp. NPDC046973]
MGLYVRHDGGILGQQPPAMLEMFRVLNGRITELWGLSFPQRPAPS